MRKVGGREGNACASEGGNRGMMLCGEAASEPEGMTRCGYGRDTGYLHTTGRDRDRESFGAGSQFSDESSAIYDLML